MHFPLCGRQRCSLAACLSVTGLSGGPCCVPRKVHPQTKLPAGACAHFRPSGLSLSVLRAVNPGGCGCPVEERAPFGAGLAGVLIHVLCLGCVVDNWSQAVTYGQQFGVSLLAAGVLASCGGAWLIPMLPLAAGVPYLRGRLLRALHLAEEKEQWCAGSVRAAAAPVTVSQHG